MNIRFYNAKILVPAENHKFQITEGELWVKGKEICYIGDGKKAWMLSAKTVKFWYGSARLTQKATF